MNYLQIKFQVPSSSSSSVIGIKPKDKWRYYIATEFILQNRFALTTEACFLSSIATKIFRTPQHVRCHSCLASPHGHHLGIITDGWTLTSAEMGVAQCLCQFH
jgi:hypothetical protein